MKKLIFLTVMVFLVACSEDLVNLNKNTKNPLQVSGESLFAGAQKELVDLISTPNVNYNNTRLWVQHWNETTYVDESNYNQFSRPISNNHWRVIYDDVLANLYKAAEIIQTVDLEQTNALKPNKLAVIEILSVYAFSNLIETFGNIPYSEALDIKILLPKYDDAKTVYTDLITRLDKAVATMTPAGSFSPAEDLIYGGNIGNWRKFANTLKLRMGVMLADVDPALSKQVVEAAYTSGVFLSNADDANYAYASSAPNNNPLNDNLVLSGRNDYVAAETLVDIMNDLADPRRANYFDPNINARFGVVDHVVQAGESVVIHFDNAPTVAPIVGNNVYIPSGNVEVPTLLGTITQVGENFIGISHVARVPEQGETVLLALYKGATIGAQSRYVDLTHTNRKMVVANYPGTILSYVEAKFLLAEAAARGYNVGTPKLHYDAAIRASFELWGSTGLTEYLAKPEVDYDTAIANSQVATPWKEVIGTQAWIGLYGRSFATYLSVRRMDYPILKKPVRNLSGFPVRYVYPTTEQNLNESNYNSAATAIGGDVPETRLFWDKEYTFDF